MRSLIKQLWSLPPDWQLVPVRGKQPLGKGWNKHPYSPTQLIEWIETGHPCTGFGLLTGTPIGQDDCVLAVDQDGDAAGTALAALARGKPLPQTATFTSGRPGRCQYLLRVPITIAPSIESRKLNVGLELRWTSMISVLPPSIHPLTKQPYQWLPGHSPNEIAIAIAPDWLVGLMARRRSHSSSKQRSRSIASKHCHQGNESRFSMCPSQLDRVAALLSRLHPCRADDYHEWIRVGMALYSHSPALLPLWDDWSRRSSKYKPGECASKWATFNPTRISINTLYYLASKDSSQKPAA